MCYSTNNTIITETPTSFNNFKLLENDKTESKIKEGNMYNTLQQ